MSLITCTTRALIYNWLLKVHVTNGAFIKIANIYIYQPSSPVYIPFSFGAANTSENACFTQDFQDM